MAALTEEQTLLKEQAKSWAAEEAPVDPAPDVDETPEPSTEG